MISEGFDPNKGMDCGFDNVRSLGREDEVI